MLETPPAATAAFQPGPASALNTGQGLSWPLVLPAHTHALEIELTVAVNRTIERLVDRRGDVPETARRQLERMAKLACAPLIKRAAVECAQAVNGAAR